MSAFGDGTVKQEILEGDDEMSNLLDDVTIPEPPVEETQPVALEEESETPQERKNRMARERYAAKKAKQTKPVPKPKAFEKGGGEDATHCSICNKPLSKPTSVSQGMGDVCAGKHKLLPAGVTIEEHIASNTVVELPAGYMKVKDAHAEVMRLRETTGISGNRFIQGFGGNGLLRPPVNDHFKVIFYKGVRYIPASCLNHLEDLRKV